MTYFGIPKWSRYHLRWTDTEGGYWIPCERYTGSWESLLTEIDRLIGDRVRAFGSRCGEDGVYGSIRNIRVEEVK